jgi:hypothetical protein
VELKLEVIEPDYRERLPSKCLDWFDIVLPWVTAGKEQGLAPGIIARQGARFLELNEPQPEEAMKEIKAREDWKEVSRITSLVHGASLMIKVDAGFLISNLKNGATAQAKAH